MHIYAIIINFEENKDMDYYKVYIQQEKTGAAMIETIDAWGMYCMDLPFRVATSVKSPMKRDWMDEDGTDEYMPEDGLKLESYDMDVKFGFKGDKFAANTAIGTMLKYMKQGYMKLYCDYTKIGRQHVRLSKLEDNAELVRTDEGDILVIKVTLTVTDPVTDIAIKDGELKEV